MYKQDTSFAAANVPLFTQLFGHISKAPSSASDLTAVPLSQQKSTRDIPIRRFYAKLHDGHRLDQSDVVRLGTADPIESPGMTLADSAAEVPWLHGTEVVEDAADQLQTGEENERAAVAAGAVTHSNLNDDVDMSDCIKCELREPAVPARQVMNELEKRFKEQVEIHRTLTASMRQLSLLESEISLHRAEQCTVGLASALSQWDRTSMEFTNARTSALSLGSVYAAPPPQQVPAAAAAPPQQQSKAPAASSSLLKSILESYEKERGDKVRGRAANSSSEPKKTLHLDVVRPPEEPVPYLRVFYVPVEKQEGGQRGNGGSVSRTPSSGTRRSSGFTSSIVEISSPARDSAVAARSGQDVETTLTSRSTSDISSVRRSSAASRSEPSKSNISSETSSSPSSLMSSSSLSSSISSSSSLRVSSVSEVLTSVRSVTTGKSSGTVATASTPRSDSSVQKSEDSVEVVVKKNKAPLVDTLREFYRACSNANCLMQMLSGGGGGSQFAKALTKPTGARKREEVEGEAHSSGTVESLSAVDGDGADSEHCEWLSALRRDVMDIRKLRRFIGRMKKNIKAIDCHQKAREARRKLFVKAQRLAKAHQKMRRGKATLSDVMEDIVDIMDSDAHRDGSDDDDVVDDFAPAAGSDGGSVMDDDVIDDLAFSVSGSGSFGSIDDAVEDAFGDSVRGDDSMLDVVDEDDMRFGGASDGSDFREEEVMEDLVSGASWGQVESDFANALADVSDVDEFLEDEVPLKGEDSVVSDIVEEDIQPAVSEKGSGSSVADVVEDIADEDPSASVATDTSGLDDADKSSVVPATSASSGSSSTASHAAALLHHRSEYWVDGNCDTQSAESALSALEREMKQTAPKRARSVHSVHLKSFTELYTVSGAGHDPVKETSPAASDVPVPSVAARGTGESKSSEPTSNPLALAERGISSDASSVEVSAVTPRSSQAAANRVSALAEGVTETREEVGSSRLASYAMDDLLAQLQWKERQLELFKQIRPLNAWEEQVSDANADGAPGNEVEYRSEYHWGVLETLAQYRFGLRVTKDDLSSCSDYSGDSEDSDVDGSVKYGSSWSDVDGDSAAFAASSHGESTDVESLTV